jgi:hypothetical protein
MQGLISFIEEWCGTGRRLALYSEKLERPYQTSRLIKYPHQVARMVKKGRPGLWCSVNQYTPEMKICLIERLYFDFDNKEKVWLARIEAENFAEVLSEHYQTASFMVFSGSKGYNLYVWLKTPIKAAEPELRRIYGTLQQMLLSGTNYKTLDPQVIGDIKRVSRIPFSVHQKTKELCVPVTQDLTPYRPDPGFTSKYRRAGINQSIVKVAVKKANDQTTPPIRPTYRIRSKDPRPCMTQIIRKNVFPCSGTGHLLLVAAVAEYHKNGYTPREIVSLFSHKTNFSYEQTNQFVSEITKRDYTPFQCSTIKELGGCVGRSCGFYRLYSDSSSQNIEDSRISPDIPVSKDSNLDGGI